METRIQWVTTQTTMMAQGQILEGAKERGVGKSCVSYRVWAVSWAAEEIQSLCWKDELAIKREKGEGARDQG